MTVSMQRIMQTSLAVAALALCLPAAAQKDMAAVDQATVATVKQHPHAAYLVDSAGWSVYLFKADAGAEGSTCYDKCAEMWPPLLTDGKPMVSGLANEELLGTIERKNGATQVTYKGWPLYYFVKDDEPGDTTGQDIKGFGAEWYLVTPEGTAMEIEGQHPSGGSKGEY